MNNEVFSFFLALLIGIYKVAMIMGIMLFVTFGYIRFVSETSSPKEKQRGGKYLKVGGFLLIYLTISSICMRFFIN